VGVKPSYDAIGRLMVGLHIWHEFPVVCSLIKVAHEISYVLVVDLVSHIVAH
jgi:hypothetical protein